jgi:hypothetical protein
MSILSSLFKHIGQFFSWFTSPKGQAVEKELAGLVVQAQPIVATIAAMTPNKTVAEVANAYTKYGVPLATSVSNDPTAIGNALLNLATAVMQKNGASNAVSLLNTAVQLALTVVKNTANKN